MNKFNMNSKPLLYVTSLLLTAAVAGCGGGSGSSGGSGGDSGGGSGSGSDSGGTTPTVTQTGTACSGSGCVDLGTAGNYAILANTGIATDAGASVITGNIATGPGVTSTAITGFALTLPAASPYATSAQVSEKVYAYDYAAPTPTQVNTASNDMGAAYTAAAAMATAGGGLTYTACPGATGAMSDANNALASGGSFPASGLPAGVYTCGVSITIPGTLTLNGSATDTWVFKTSGTLDQAAATNVVLSGGALAKNVFWQVAGAVTIGATANFKGIILGQTGITFGNNSAIDGRLLAQTAVTLDATTVTQP